MLVLLERAASNRRHNLMKRVWTGALLPVVLVLTLAPTLVRFEHRRSVVAELWIASLPAGFEVSLQRIEDTGAWEAFWFDDRGGNQLLFHRQGVRPEPKPTPVNDRGTVVA
jgi:hypothetical protein